jgi:Nuclear condensing complex subunits, C-term domain
LSFECSLIRFSQAKRITDFLLQMLDSDDSPDVRAVLCTGICKLLLAGIITEPRVGFPKPISAALDVLTSCIGFKLLSLDVYIAKYER